MAKELFDAGADIVYCADSKKIEGYIGEAWTKIIADALRKIGPDVVLASATNVGKDLMARVATKLDAGLATDCIDLEVKDGKLIAKRPIYAGKLHIKVAFNSKIQMATLRPNIFKALEEPYAKSQKKVENISADVSDKELRAKIMEKIECKSEMPDLTEADIIVSGGRGMKGSENFAMLEELAGLVKGTVGASRSAVDAGWRPQCDQVGQTGKVVSPQLYVACGISGAVQHQAGMGTSKCIVAINKDPNAPMFKIASYGIVADLFKIVPALTKEIKKKKEAES
jgi:electron transfer flavoprotein alpha subunit